jgi:hypothetical protein
MRLRILLGTLLVAPFASAQARAGDYGQCEPPQQGLLARLHPVGGFNPYGGGIFHWWNPHCFPRSCTLDDYRRKPLPRVCWPAYPAYYIQAPPQAGPPCGDGRTYCGTSQ